MHERYLMRYASNPGLFAKRNRKWREANKDKVREINRVWTAANPERLVATKHRRRARKAAAAGYCTAADLLVLRSILGDSCLKCGSRDRLAWDHIIPLCPPFNGPDGPTNKQPLYKSCNSSKGHYRATDYRTKAQRKQVASAFQRLLFPQ